jgi:ABC-type sugar transport system ATPase subunit
MVDLVEYLGDDVLLTVALPGQLPRQVSALVPANAAPAVGMTIGFSASPDALHLFDAESGLSCRRAAPVLEQAGRAIRDAS